MHSNDIISFIPQFKLFSLFNDIPTPDNEHDTGFWKRLKCVKFPILFTDNPKGDFEKKINKDLKTNIPNWKNDFLLYFIEWMNIYKKNGLIFPKDVESVTKNYKSDNNFFEKYVSLHLKKNRKVYCLGEI